MNQYKTMDTLANPVPAQCPDPHCRGFVSPHSQTCNKCGRYVGF